MADSNDKCYISVRDIQSALVPDGFVISVETDISCHLHLRWSRHEPRIHDKPVLRRGLRMHGDRYFCFTTFLDNEQEEPGDTLTHTFLKYEWAICEDIYFYFWGKVAALTCQSTTAIFKLHRKEIEMYVISLGKLTEEEILQGHVKLKQGPNIIITRRDADNALEIATPASATFLGLTDTPASYAGKSGQNVVVKSTLDGLEFKPKFGFGNEWLWWASDDRAFPAGTFIYDQMRQAVESNGLSVYLFTTPHLCYGLDWHQTLQFKLGRITPLGGTPKIAIALTEAQVNILDNPTTPHIGFRIEDSNIYGENANGANRTSTLLWTSDMITPFWFRWERHDDHIDFILNTTIYATHNTNLPIQNKNCVFVYQMRGIDAQTRAFAITHPEFGRV